MVNYRFDIGDRLALSCLSTWALRPFGILNRGPPSRSRPSNNHISQHNYKAYLCCIDFVFCDSMCLPFLFNEFTM